MLGLRLVLGLRIAQEWTLYSIMVGMILTPCTGGIGTSPWMIKGQAQTYPFKCIRDRDMLNLGTNHAKYLGQAISVSMGCLFCSLA